MLKTLTNSLVLRVSCNQIVPIYTHLLLEYIFFISKQHMDSFLRDLCRLKTIQIIDEKSKKDLGIFKRATDFRFGEPGNNKISESNAFFSSLILERMPVNITILVQPTVRHQSMLTKRHIVFIRFTSLVSRLSNLKKPQNPYLNNALTFPFGIGRLNGHSWLQRTQTFNFITCDGAQTVLSYAWTFSPMQWQVWVATLIAIAGIVSLLKIVLAQNVFWFLFANILEQSDSLLDKISRGRINVSRLILGVYLLAAIILTNGTYILNITNHMDIVDTGIVLN